MAVNCSTGFRTLILGPTSFESIFGGGAIEVRTGPQPANADLPPSGTLVARLTDGGGAWTPGSPTNGLGFVRTGFYVQNTPAQDWVLAGVADGVAGWFRLLPNAPDSGLASTVLPRIDGAIGPIDAAGDFQMRLPLLTMSTSVAITVPSWWFVLPPLS